MFIAPAGRNANIEEKPEVEVRCFGNLKRMVRRNPKSVSLVLIDGKIAVKTDESFTLLGREKLGRVLRERVQY